LAGGWRRLHNEELRNLYASPNIIMVIVSSRTRWTRQVAWTRLETHAMILLENLKGLDNSEDLGTDGRIISEWILGK